MCVHINSRWQRLTQEPMLWPRTSNELFDWSYFCLGYVQARIKYNKTQPGKHYLMTSVHIFLHTVCFL